MTTERNPSVPDYGCHPTNHRRKAIPATCQLHQGPVEPTNLMVSKHNGTIVLDPQVLRHEALCCIPYRVGRDLEEYLWV